MDDEVSKATEILSWHRRESRALQLIVRVSISVRSTSISVRSINVASPVTLGKAADAICIGKR
jgi:hypothetical protein